MGKIHETADVSDAAELGENVRIWNWVQIRENSKIGDNSIISKGAYIDHGVILGKNVKVQNNVSIYYEAEIEDGVFIAPHVCFTNDKFPRSINPDGTLKSGGSEGDDWEILKTTVKKGASIGANATILSGLTIGEWALIAAGSVVTKSIPPYGLAMGAPARVIGYVCRCAKKLDENRPACDVCGVRLEDVRE